MPDNHTINSLAELLQGDNTVLEKPLDLDLGGYTMRIRSNNLSLLDVLAEYFSHVVTTSSKPDIEIIAIEREVLDSGLEFIDWAREPGKTGRKDAYFDIPGARMVLKVRTGMLFLQSETVRMAAGPCLQYANQVINFINSQYMNWLQRNGWLICHASGLDIHGRGVGIAGFSGGGKSTLMLNLLEEDGVNFVSNDRLFVHTGEKGTFVRGIPKLPRINPGTIVHNARLHGMLSPQRREELLQLPVEELWHLEEKYDVFIDQVYGPGRISTEAELQAFVIINWQRDSSDDTQVTEVDITQRRELLAALMKSPGPFYQYADGSFHSDTADFDENAYIEALHGVTVYEVTGKTDFAQAGRRLAELLEI